MHNIDEAMAHYRALVSQYGLQWTAAVPSEAWDELAKINKILTEGERRDALGLPETRRHP